MFYKVSRTEDYLSAGPERQGEKWESLSILRRLSVNAGKDAIISIALITLHNEMERTSNEAGQPEETQQYR